MSRINPEQTVADAGKMVKVGSTGEYQLFFNDSLKDSLGTNRLNVAPDGIAILTAHLSPENNNTRTLGTIDRKWKNIFLSGYLSDGKNANYGLTLPDTTSFNANKQLATQEEVDNLKNIGRFLSLWNASTGVATSNPPTSPYEYKTGDYFRVSNGGNRIPTGSSYVIGGTNYTTSIATLGLGDVVYYDGTSWQIQSGTGQGTVLDVQINGTSIVGVDSSPGIANIVTSNFVTKNNESQALANGIHYEWADSTNTYKADIITTTYNGNPEFEIALTKNNDTPTRNFIAPDRWQIDADIVPRSSGPHFLGGAAGNSKWKAYLQLMGSSTQTTYGLVAPDTSSFAADKTIATTDQIPHLYRHSFMFQAVLNESLCPTDVVAEVDFSIYSLNSEPYIKSTSTTISDKYNDVLTALTMYGGVFGVYWNYDEPSRPISTMIMPHYFGSENYIGILIPKPLSGTGIVMTQNMLLFGPNTSTILETVSEFDESVINDN